MGNLDNFPQDFGAEKSLLDEIDLEVLGKKIEIGEKFVTFREGKKMSRTVVAVKGDILTAPSESGDVIKSSLIAAVVGGCLEDKGRFADVKEKFGKDLKRVLQNLGEINPD